MVDSQQLLLFQNLKRIKDYWVVAVPNNLAPDAALIWPFVEDDIHKLTQALNTQQQQEAFSWVLNDVISE